MSKYNYSVGAFFVVLLVLRFAGDTSMADDTRALDILRKCADNLKRTDRIQYEVEMRHSYHAPATRTGVQPHEYVEAVVRKEGSNIAISGIEKQYDDGKFIRDEEIRLVTTPEFFVVGFSGESAKHSAGIVATERVNERLPSILCSGQFGFEMDGYLCDGVRFSDLMLLESDKVKYIGEENINGYTCQQIDADTKYGFFSIYVDAGNNYAIRRAVARIGQDTLLHSGIRWLHDSPHTEMFTRTLDNLEFKMIEGVAFPVRGDFQVFRKDKDGHSYMSRNEFERGNIDLNPAFRKDTFSADFLNGEVVSNQDDTTSGVVYVWDGKKPVPAYTMLKGTAFMQGYAGYIRLALMLAGIAMIAYALYRMLRRRKNHEK